MKETGLSFQLTKKIYRTFTAISIVTVLTGQCSLPKDPEPPCPTPRIVIAGESWWIIANQYGWTVEQLQGFNRIYDGRSVLLAGETINVPGSGPCPTSTPKS